MGTISQVTIGLYLVSWEKWSVSRAKALAGARELSYRPSRVEPPAGEEGHRGFMGSDKEKALST